MYFKLIYAILFGLSNLDSNYGAKVQLRILSEDSTFCKKYHIPKYQLTFVYNTPHAGAVQSNVFWFNGNESGNRIEYVERHELNVIEAIIWYMVIQHYINQTQIDKSNWIPI